MSRRPAGDDFDEYDASINYAPSVGHVSTFQAVPVEDEPVEREFPPGFDLRRRNPVAAPRPSGKTRKRKR